MNPYTTSHSNTSFTRSITNSSTSRSVSRTATMSSSTTSLDEVLIQRITQMAQIFIQLQTNKSIDPVGPKHTRQLNELRQLVEIECRRRSDEDSHTLLINIYQRLLTHSQSLMQELNQNSHAQPIPANQLVHQSIAHQQRITLELMDELLDLIVLSQHESILIRLANILRQLLQQSTTEFMILRAAASTLGHLVRLASPLTGDLVNFQVKQAFEWLQQDELSSTHHTHDSRLLAGVLVLKEMASNAPTLFNVYVPHFLDVVWIPLRSTQVDVRESATLALRVCLLDISQRADRWKRQCWTKLFDVVQLSLQINESEPNSHTFTTSDTTPLTSVPHTPTNGSATTTALPDNTASPAASASASTATTAIPLKSRSSESVHESIARIHGALLTLGELLEHADHEFLAPHFTSIMDLIMHYRFHSSRTIRRTIMILLPRAARLSDTFRIEYLRSVIEYLEQHMETDYRDTAFLSLGRLASSVGTDLVQYLPVLIKHLTTSLSLTISIRPDTAPIPPTTKSSSTTSFFGFLRSKSTDSTTVDTQAELHRKYLRFTNTAMSAISLLAAALQDSAQPSLEPLIALLFQTGLSQPLIDVLTSISTHNTALRPIIQDRLLDLLYTILHHSTTVSITHTPTHQVKPHAKRSVEPRMQKVHLYGAPETTTTLSTLPGGRTPVSLLPPASRLTSIRTPIEVREHDTNAISLALSTFATFDFDTQPETVLAMTRELIQPFTNEDLEIRLEAVRTLTTIIPKLVNQFLHSSNYPYVFELLKHLLILSISDPSPAIRFTIVSAFLSYQTTSNAPPPTHPLTRVPSDASFTLLDPNDHTDSTHPTSTLILSLLAHPESLSSLAFGLSDEVFLIRDRVLALVGSLAPRNPTIILPMLRTFLLQLLQNLQHQPSDSKEPALESTPLDGSLSQVDLQLAISPSLTEQHAKLLLTLISYSGGQKLCKHYAPAILTVLLPRLTQILALDALTNVRLTGDTTSVSHLMSGTASSSSQLISCMLSTLGKLSMLAGADMRPSINLLLQLIVSTLQQQTSTLVVMEEKELNLRRTVAIHTLSQLITSTGQVIQPYLQYPTLLPTLLRLICLDHTRAGEISHTSTDESHIVDEGKFISTPLSRPNDLHSLSAVPLLSHTSQREFRIELLKLIGKIGTLNPFRFKQQPMLFIQSNPDLTTPTQNLISSPAIDFLTQEPQVAELLTQHMEMDKLDPQSVLHEIYFPTVAFRSLLQILRNPRLIQYHSLVLRAMLFIYRSLGAAKCAPFLPLVMPFVLSEMLQLVLPAPTLHSTPSVLSSPTFLSTRHDSPVKAINSPHMTVINTSSTTVQLQINYIQHLIGVIHIVGIQIRPYLAHCFFLIFGGSPDSSPPAFIGLNSDVSVMLPYWRESILLPYLLKLIEVITVGLKAGGGDEEFKVTYLPIIMAKLLELIQEGEKKYSNSGSEFVLDSGDSATHILLKLLHTIQVLSTNISGLDEFLPLLVPALLRMMERSVQQLQRLLVPSRSDSSRVMDITRSPAYHLSVSLVHTLTTLFVRTASTPFASRLLHTICRLLQSPFLTPSTLTESCFELICLILSQLGFQFLVYFEPLVTHSIKHLVQQYETSNFHPRNDKSPLFVPHSANQVFRVSSSPSLQSSDIQTMAHKKTLLETLRDTNAADDHHTTDGTNCDGEGDSGSGATTPDTGPHMHRSQSARTITANTTTTHVTNHGLAKFQTMLQQLKDKVQTVQQDSKAPSISNGNQPPLADLSNLDLFHLPLFESVTNHHTILPTSSNSDLESLVLPSAASRNVSYADLAAIEAQLDANDHESIQSPPSVSGPKKLYMSQQNLMRGWTATQRSTKDDWFVWMRGFSIELLKESPSPALRACSFLAQKYPPLSQTLFHAAFLSCWSELTDAYQDDLIANLEFIFTKCTPTSPSTTVSTMTHSTTTHMIPTSIVTSLLNLVEFMEHSEKTLPISINLLSVLSERSHAFATALHYREMEFKQTSPASQLATADDHTQLTLTTNTIAAELTIESLITINNKLGQKSAADGILTLVAQQQIEVQQKHYREQRQRERSQSTVGRLGFFPRRSSTAPTPHITLNPLWFEKLHRWQDALEVYERKQEEMVDALTPILAQTTTGASNLSVTAILDQAEFAGRNEFVDVLMGKMRCLRSLGEWDQLATIAQGVWNTTEDPIVRRELCGLAASAAVNLRRWESLAPLLIYFDEDASIWSSSSQQSRSRLSSSSQVRHRFDSNYYAAIFLIHRGRYDEARVYLDRAAEVLDPSLSALLSESYARAYKSLLLVQRLVQLEEVIEFKLESTSSSSSLTPRQRLLYHMWHDRITGGLSLEGDDIVDGWNELLAIQQLVNSSNTFTNEANLDLYLQFCEILRNQSQDHGTITFTRPNVTDSSLPPISSSLLKRSEWIMRNVVGFDPIELIQDLLNNNNSSVNNTSTRTVLSLPSISMTTHRIKQLTDTIRPAHKLPHVLFVLWKLLYSQGYHQEAFNKLKEMVTQTNSELDVFSRIALAGEVEAAELDRLKAICYVKLGKWQSEMLEASWSSRVTALTDVASTPARTPFASSPVLSNSPITFNYPDPVLTRAASTGSVAIISRADSAASKSLSEILEFYRTATVLNPKYAKAWHEFAMLNAKVCTTWKSIILPPTHHPKPPPLASSPGTPLSSSSSSVSASPNTIPPILTSYIVSAITAFFRSISLQPVGDNSLQDILRILALWFEYGATEPEEITNDFTSFHGLSILPMVSASPSPPPPQIGLASNSSDSNTNLSLPSISEAMQQGFQLISIDNWLAVIPQLLARIHVTSSRIRSLLFELLGRLGRQHPQALIYPLTVASKSPLACRHQSASLLLDSLASHSRSLVTQGSLVSTELVRVAILWHEMWHEALNEASILWQKESDFDGMLKLLEPLHLMIPNAQTIAENTFVTNYGRELQEAYGLVKKYAETKEGHYEPSIMHRLNAMTGDQHQSTASNYMARAWSLYTDVYHRLTEQITSTTELELSDISPNLLFSRELELAVPGTYRSGQPVIRIASFASLLHVIESKQHPRRLTILGSNGVEYPFLLKGHEDLRQDERVMQLLGLINTLLQDDHATSKSDLSIRRYEVIPLSPNSGLIEWVPNSTPLHTIIKRYRDQKHILVNIEQRLMMKFAPQQHLCTIMQKVEVFLYALNMTSGQDLANTLWYHAPSSHVWLERRECFTRSTAVMSMVGYILGLGDRHTCNLLLDPHGRLVHIDFGDCFEVSMHRERYPEKVPFRLTRMMVNAFEVAGIEGTFRQTSEQVMRVIRKNKNSVMAVLEAFSLDPLLNWRLFDSRKKTVQPSSSPVRPAHTNDNLAPPPLQSADPNNEEKHEHLPPKTTTAIGPIVAEHVLIAEQANVAPVNGGTAFANMTRINVGQKAVGAVPVPTPASARAKQESTMIHAAADEPGFPTTATNLSSNLVPVDEDDEKVLPPSPINLRRRTSVIDESVIGSTLMDIHPLGTLQEGRSRMDEVNAQAVAVMKRVESKLKGLEFKSTQTEKAANSSTTANATSSSSSPTPHAHRLHGMSVSEQVQRLIEEATSPINLAQAYIGWCPFW